MVSKLSSPSETPEIFLKLQITGPLTRATESKSLGITSMHFFKALPLIDIIHLILEPTATCPLIKITLNRITKWKERSYWLSTHTPVLELGYYIISCDSFSNPSSCIYMFTISTRQWDKEMLRGKLMSLTSHS